MAIIIPEKYTVPLYLFHQGENSHAYELFGFPPGGTGRKERRSFPRMGS